MNNRTLNNLEIANANTIIKEFSNSNPNLRKCSSNIHFQGDRYQNFLSSQILLITNLTFNLKIFEEILSHLHGNYKQDI